MSEKAYDVFGHMCGIVTNDERFFEPIHSYGIRLFVINDQPYAIKDRDFTALNDDEARAVIAHMQQYLAQFNDSVARTQLLIDMVRRNQPYNMPSAQFVPRSRRNPSGYVYLLQSPSGAYKIGITKSPASRARTFGVQLPFEVEFVAVIKTDDMHALESELHTRFAAKRINGEWFALDSEDVEYIKGLAK